MENVIDITVEDARYLIEYSVDADMVQYYEEIVFGGVDNLEWNGSQLLQFLSEYYPDNKYRLVEKPEEGDNQNVVVLQEQEKKTGVPGMAADGYTANLSKKYLLHQTKYVYDNWLYATNAAGKFGFDPIVQLAQGVQESSWGRSDPAKIHNAYFGIKVSSNTNEYWSGEYRTNKNGKFRNYSSAQNSFYDHARLIAESERYPLAFSAAKLNYKKYANEIAYGPYIVDSDNRPVYEKNLISIYETIFNIAVEGNLFTPNIV